METQTKYAACINGTWRTENSIGALVDKVQTKYPSRTVEVFEMKPIGRYRRKIEVEQVPEPEVPEVSDIDEESEEEDYG